jgi:hypothetical protein
VAEGNPREPGRGTLRYYYPVRCAPHRERWTGRRKRTGLSLPQNTPRHLPFHALSFLEQYRQQHHLWQVPLLKHIRQGILVVSLPSLTRSTPPKLSYLAMFPHSSRNQAVAVRTRAHGCSSRSAIPPRRHPRDPSGDYDWWDRDEKRQCIESSSTDAPNTSTGVSRNACAVTKSRPPTGRLHQSTEWDNDTVDSVIDNRQSPLSFQSNGICKSPSTIKDDVRPCTSASSSRQESDSTAVVRDFTEYRTALAKKSSSSSSVKFQEFVALNEKELRQTPPEVLYDTVRTLQHQVHVLGSALTWKDDNATEFALHLGQTWAEQSNHFHHKMRELRQRHETQVEDMQSRIERQRESLLVLDTELFHMRQHLANATDLPTPWSMPQQTVTAEDDDSDNDSETSSSSASWLQDEIPSDIVSGGENCPEKTDTQFLASKVEGNSWPTNVVQDTDQDASETYLQSLFGGGECEV